MRPAVQERPAKQHGSQNEQTLQGNISNCVAAVILLGLTLPFLEKLEEAPLSLFSFLDSAHCCRAMTTLLTYQRTEEPRLFISTFTLILFHKW